MIKTREEIIAEIQKKIAITIYDDEAETELFWQPYKFETEAKEILALVVQETADTVGFLRWQEVDPYDGRTLGAAVRAIRETLEMGEY